MVGFSACDGYVEEENFTNLTGETYLTEDNADQLVVGVYQSLRDIYKDYDIAFYGTDIFTSTKKIDEIHSLNEYFDINASDESISKHWKHNYEMIANANVVIDRFEEISWSDSKLSEKAYGIAQAKGLRALAYYNLVQQFGGVVLELKESKTIKDDYERSTEEECFVQIIKDFEEAIPVLVNDTDFGRLSKKAAQHILADVYMTRSYKSFAGSDDEKMAYELAEASIGTYDIRSQSFEQVFSYDNQENNEILFSVQYGDGGEYEDRDNNKHVLFRYKLQDFAGISRQTSYAVGGKGSRPSQYLYTLFADNDTRDAVTFHRALLADEESAYESDNGSEVINPGDTVVYFPMNMLPDVELANGLNKYWVFQPDEYFFDEKVDVDGVLYQYSNRNIKYPFPIFKKFDDENFIESEDGGGGHRDTYVYRVSETHLLAAEAYLKAGNQSKALEHINIVRERATGDANHYTSITLDDILNERAVELAGEENRWNILKRTGKLEERINLYNAHVMHHGKFDSHNLLRPIPEHEIFLSNGALKQNPGY